MKFSYDWYTELWFTDYDDAIIYAPIEEIHGFKPYKKGLHNKDYITLCYVHPELPCPQIFFVFMYPRYTKYHSKQKSGLRILANIMKDKYQIENAWEKVQANPNKYIKLYESDLEDYFFNQAWREFLKWLPEDDKEYWWWYTGYKEYTQREGRVFKKRNEEFEVLTEEEQQKHCLEFSNAILETKNKISLMWDNIAKDNIIKPAHSIDEVYYKFRLMIDELEQKGHELIINSILKDYWVELHINVLKEDLYRSLLRNNKNKMDTSFITLSYAVIKDCGDKLGIKVA